MDVRVPFLGLGFGRSGFLGVSPLSFFASQDSFLGFFFLGGILFGEMADNGWTVCISRCFGGVLRGENQLENREFVWNGRIWLEEERKWEELSVMSGWGMEKREVRQSEWD